MILTPTMEDQSSRFRGIGSRRARQIAQRRAPRKPATEWRHNQAHGASRGKPYARDVSAFVCRPSPSGAAYNHGKANARLGIGQSSEGCFMSPLPGLGNLTLKLTPFASPLMADAVGCIMPPLRGSPCSIDPSLHHSITPTLHFPIVLSLSATL